MNKLEFEDSFLDIDYDEKTLKKIDELNNLELKLSDKYNSELDMIEKIENHEIRNMKLEKLNKAYEYISENLEAQRFLTYKKGREIVEKKEYLKYF